MQLFIAQISVGDILFAAIVNSLHMNLKLGMQLLIAQISVGDIVFGATANSLHMSMLLKCNLTMIGE